MIAHESLGGIKILRVNMKQVCEMLGCSRDMVNRYRRDDPTFPQPFKEGDTRQAAAFFDYQEIIDWYENWKKRARMDNQSILVA